MSGIDGLCATASDKSCEKCNSVDHEGALADDGSALVRADYVVCSSDDSCVRSVVYLKDSVRVSLLNLFMSRLMLKSVILHSLLRMVGCRWISIVLLRLRISVRLNRPGMVRLLMRVLLRRFLRCRSMLMSCDRRFVFRVSRLMFVVVRFRVGLISRLGVIISRLRFCLRLVCRVVRLRMLVDRSRLILICCLTLVLIL